MDQNHRQHKAEPVQEGSQTSDTPPISRRDTLRLALRFAAASCLAGGLSACRQDELPSLRLGLNSWLGYAPLFYARDRGLLASSRVRLVEIPTSGSVQRALRNQSVELAALTLDEVIRVHADGVPCKILWVADISAGGDAIIARPPLSTMGDLRGKPIGVEDNALGAYILQRALDINRIDVSEVIVHRLTPMEQRQAYLSGKIDAIVTFEPMLSDLVKDGAHVVFSSREIPWEVIDVIVARADIAHARLESLKILAQAWFESLRGVKDRDRDLIQHLARREQQPPEQISQALKGIIFPDRKMTWTVLRNTNGLEQNIARLMTFQHNRDPYMKSFAPSEMVDMDLCQHLLGPGA